MKAKKLCTKKEKKKGKGRIRFTKSLK